MAAIDRLATGTGTTPSSDVTVDPGDSLTIGLKGVTPPNIPAGAKVYVYCKDEVGSYWRWDILTTAKPAVVLSAGVWRFARAAGSASCGVYSA
jgi:hypothetical protein